MRFKNVKNRVRRAVEVISDKFLTYKSQKLKESQELIGNWTKSNEIQSGLETFSSSTSDLS